MSSSSSFSSSSRWSYDVFLSFRGETRRTFVAHLHDALKTAEIKTYIDDLLVKGTELGPELMRAIEGSRISIVVFSETYTESSWCLKELEHIMKCRRNLDQVVLPVFYHVEPSAVRHQTGSFGIALQDTVKRGSSGVEMMENELSNLTSTLTEAANLCGWIVNEFKNEAVQISKIVDEVKRRVDKRFLNITQYQVGLDTRVQQVSRSIEIQSNKVCLIGIWGMGGSGKTTVARAIYNQFHRTFMDHSFIENIREVSNRGDEGIIFLQKQLLLNLSKINENMYNTAQGKSRIDELLKGKRALIVLDDVSKFEQVQYLCGNREYFGPGSVLIVTSRDVNILKKLKVDDIYSIKEMNKIKSLELFSWHAFGQAHPIENFRQLSEEMVACCEGLPMALEAIGSSLRETTTEKLWRCTLSKLRRIPNNRVQKTLRISYDGLNDDTEKDIFLDICCFFIGKDISYVTEILNGCGLFADIGIADLVNQSLLKVEKNNKLGMHCLLQDMGREIVRERSTKLPGKRSRLWFDKDVHEVLEENSGTDSVEGLVLKPQSNKKVPFKTESFMGMKNLRLLQLDHVDLTGDYVHLSQKLIWLHWQGFKDTHIPDNFFQQKLVVFELERSSIKQVWNETNLMEMLKILNLSHSKSLKTTPDFSTLPNLEKLIMKNCPRLSKVHESIGDLRNLLLINLKDCTSLRNLPKTINQLESLTTLILSGCSKIDNLEDGIVQMESLTTLAINDTGVKAMPYSRVRLKSIGYISLCGCEGLSRDVFHSVIQSWMSPTMNLPFDNPDFLTPIVRSLQQLRTVWIQCHSENQLTQELKIIFDDQYGINSTESEALQIPNDSWRSHLIGMGSFPTVMDTLGKSVSQGLTTNDSSNFLFLGGNHLSYLSYTGVGPSAPFQVPKDIDCHMEGIALCVVYSSTSKKLAAECLTGVLIVNYTKCTIHIYKQDTIMSFNDEDWKNLTSNLGPGDDVKIYVAFGHGLIVKKTIVYLVSGQSIIVEVEPPEEGDVLPSPQVEVQQSSNSNRNIFTRLGALFYA